MFRRVPNSTNFCSLFIQKSRLRTFGNGFVFFILQSEQVCDSPLSCNARISFTCQQLTGIKNPPTAVYIILPWEDMFLLFKL